MAVEDTTGVRTAALRVRVEGAVVHVDMDLEDGLLPLDAAAELTGLLRRPPEGAHVLVLRSVGDAFCLGRERTAATAQRMYSKPIRSGWSGSSGEDSTPLT